MYTYICIIFIEFVNSIASVIYVFIFLFLAMRHTGSLLPQQGWNLHPLCTTMLEASVSACSVVSNSLQPDGL